MEIYTKEEAQDKINALGQAGNPFVFIISYDQSKAYVEETSALDAATCMFAFPHFCNIPDHFSCNNSAPEWRITPPDRARYEASINLVKRNQVAGNCRLANLTCKVPIATNLTMRDIFLRSQARYRCWVKDEFVCFSPEIFVQVQQGVIRTFPMKGTLDATLPNAERTLMENPKEVEEHAMIVDLLSSELAQVAHGVQVDRYRYIEHLTTNKGEILQTSSEISGHVSDYYQSHFGELLYRLLPAGSIAGAPKRQTVDLIRQAEDYDRGFYTGIMGYCANGELDTAVMIRFIDQEDGQLYYKAGGGITAQSNNDDEYREVIEKVYVPIY